MSAEGLLNPKPGELTPKCSAAGRKAAGAVWLSPLLSFRVAGLAVFDPSADPSSRSSCDTSRPSRSPGRADLEPER